jgi:putative PIN family toxin of toxin-antitoxin system
MRSDPKTPPKRIVLDTNVLASALAFGGVPRSVLELGRRGIIELFFSAFILDELRKVLLSRKVRWQPFEVQAAIREIESFGRLADPKEKVSAISSFDADNRILECALEARAEAIVTGNLRHIRPLGDFRGIRILTPREFIDEFFPGV